ncbi:MAG TPA: hypothetical protein PK990_03550 [Salinivirgaceae bacterium]|nr:hypothetical protein [Salinivirgaceae bacterium]
MKWRILAFCALNGILAFPPFIHLIASPEVDSDKFHESFYRTLPLSPVSEPPELLISFFDTLENDKSLIINSFIYSDSSIFGISRLNKYQKKRLNVDSIEQDINSIIKEYNRLGYPFFAITLKPVFISSDSFNIYVVTENYSQRILIDTLVLPLDCKVSKSFVSGYLNLHEGDVFDVMKLQHYQQRIKRLNFLEMNAPLQARFSTGGAILEFPLVARINGSFTGIVGITKSSDDNKTKLIGDVQFSLQNALKHGESINLNWKRPSPQSQFLDLFAEYPYIAGSQYGLVGNVDLQKRDTSLVILRNSLYGVLYKQSLRFSVGIDFFSSNTLTNSGQGQNTSRRLYSGKISFSPEGRRPHSDGSYDVKFSLGKRTQADSLRHQSIIFETVLNAEQKIPINEIFGVKTSTSLGTIQSREKLNRAELFTLGGLRTLRGFDEKSLFVRHWIYSTFELHWFFEPQSTFFSYLQLGRYFLGVVDNVVPKNFFSFGLGAEMNLGSGELMVIWANGANWGEKLYLGKSKLHVGYRIRF